MKAPLPFFEGAGLQNTYIFPIANQITSIYGIRAPKKHHLSLKNWLKCRFFCAQNRFSNGLFCRYKYSEGGG